MKRLFTLLIVLCVSLLAYAQTDVRTRGSGGGQDQPTQPQAGKRRVNGRIVDANGEPMVGATVTILNAASKNVITGGFTNANGEFDLQADATGSQLLRVNYVGYKIQEVSIDAQSAGLNISMQEDVLKLDEVVVVGFGQQSRKEVTGSYSTISGNDIQNLPVNSVENALQGRIPGIFVQQGSGRLGQAVQVRIRGAASINASSQPLYVVDGIPITTQNLDNLTGEATNPMADINPNDIESVDVLKDGYASAIYGSRASNGVIIITTKRGKVGRTNVNIGYYYGVSEPTRYRGYLSSPDYALIINEARANTGFGLINFGSATNIARGVSTTNTTDWEKEIYQKGVNQQIDVNVSGGNEKTQFFLGVTHNEQNGILRGQSFTRSTARINLDHAISNKIKVGTSTSLYRTANVRSFADNQFQSLTQAVALAPVIPFNEPATGSPWLADPITGYDNPLNYLGKNTLNSLGVRTINNFYVSFELIPDLTFRSEAGLDWTHQNEIQWTSERTTLGIQRSGGYASNNYTSYVTWNTNNFFEYKKIIADNHAIQAIAGWQYTRGAGDFNSVTGEGLPNDQYRDVSSAARITAGRGGGNGYVTHGWFARVNYRFKDRYLLGASYRGDYSSRFGPKNRWGYFPSVSVGWIVTEEPWFKDNGIFTSLKPRFSIGLTGNQEFGDFAYRSFAQQVGYKLTTGLQPTTASSNSELKWESTLQYDFGVDMSLLKDRISITVDWYRKDTRDLLLTRQVPGVSGFTNVQANVGNVLNTGIEGVITGVVIDQAKIRLTSSVNFSFNENRLTNTDGQIIPVGFDEVGRVATGLPIGGFFVPKYYGVNPQNGDALFVGPDGNPTNDYNLALSQAQQFIGPPIHPWQLGFNNSLTIYGFDVNMFWQCSFGGYVYNAGAKFMTAQFGGGRDNQTTDIVRRWTTPGQITDVPQARFGQSNGGDPSSRFVYKADYVRLKTLTIGYTIPQRFVKVLGMRSARFYFTGQNLITITAYPGADPEVSFTQGRNTFLTAQTQVSLGQDFYTAPQARSYIFGVNIGF